MLEIIKLCWFYRKEPKLIMATLKTWGWSKNLSNLPSNKGVKMNFRKTIVVLKREIRTTRKHKNWWADRDPDAAKRDEKFITELYKAINILGTTNNGKV